jgi:hypothetical protein
MEVQVEINDDKIEIDTGHSYLSLSLDDAKLLKNKLEEKLRTIRDAENLEKDWNFFGGL